MKKFKCFAFLSTAINDECRKTSGIWKGDCGYANGYVAIPKNHPLYRKTYDEANDAGINVHGGLTFSASIVDVLSRFDLWGVDWLDGEIPEDYWVFGFDTLHYGDTLEEWSCEKCIAEVNKLKKQFENYIEK